MLKIKILHSKTDQWRQGDEILVVRTTNSICPVAMLECYMQMTGMFWEDQCFLFRPIQASKKGQILRASGKISYSCLREAFRKKTANPGFPLEKFGLYSLRAGGATTATNANVMDRCFKRHRRWRSQNTKNGFYKDNVESRLEVSKSLGLHLG